MAEKVELSLVYRGARPGAQSIERLFRALEPFFSKKFVLHRIVLPRSSTSLRGILQNIIFVRKHARGIVHLTGDVNYVIPFLRAKRTLLTIHDCGHLMNLRGWKKFVYKWMWFKIPCMAASRISMISEATLEVIDSLVGSYGEKTSVIDDCSTVSIGLTPRDFNSSRPRILQIGTGHHKNLDTLIKAIDGFNCELRIVGNPSPEDRRELIARKICHKIETNVSDARIEEIYHEVDILFFASRHEGFGLPIIEAQQAGIPVITSNRLSMPKVSRGAAILVDPESVEGIRDAVELLVSSASQRKKLVARGLLNAERFTPSRIAEEYMKVYREMAGNCSAADPSK